MAIKKKPQVFVAGDGREFANETDATLHDDLLQATSNYDRAKKQLGRAVALVTKTADGYCFEFGLWKTYWFVTQYHGGQPTLRSIDDSWMAEVVLGCHDHSEVRLAVHPNAQDRRFEIAIGDLYVEKKNAELALAEKLREYIAERPAELEKITGGAP